MLALRWHGRRDVRLDEVPEPPPPGPGELQLRVLWCGLCGTDVEEYRSGPIFVPVEQPNPLTGRKAPLTLGHEFAAEVVAVGAGATFEPGQRVAADTLIWCGRCYWCLRHQVSLCERLAALGLMADGGLAELCNAPETTCLRVPDGVSDEAAALAETLAVGVRALRRGRLSVGERVVVVGAGAVGLMALQAARASGASHVALVEPRADRRSVGAALGASEVLEPAAAEEVGADLVLECSGNPRAIGTALAAARKRGRVVLVGIYPEPASVSFLDVVTTEKELLGSFSHVYDEDFAAALTLLQHGGVQVEPIISDRIPLDQAVERGLAALEREPEAHLKILVSPRLVSSPSGV